MKVSTNTRERFGALVGFFMECFKVCMACMLSIFVPQQCGNTICTINENFRNLDPYNIVVLVINFLTIGSFFSLYVIELYREYWMIQYLDIDRKKGEVNMEKTYYEYTSILSNLKEHNNRYYITSFVTLGLFILNVICSSVLVFGMYYYDYRTATTLLTNVLLLVNKLSTCITISNRSKQEFLAISYYTVDNLSYNTIDDDYLLPPRDLIVNESDEVNHNVIRNYI